MERLALEGQLIQETVLAAELAAAEARQQARARELQTELAQVRVAEQAVPDGTLEVRRRLQELESELCSLQLEEDPDLLESLQAEEQRAQEALRQERSCEVSAQKELEAYQAASCELKAKGALLVDDVEDPAEEVHRELVACLPFKRQASLLQLLEDLDSEKQVVAGELAEDVRHAQVRQEVEELSAQLGVLEATAARRAQRCAAAKAEIRRLGEALGEVDDLHAQAAGLEKANQLLDRQRAEWKRSQTLMLRLAEDLQKHPPKDQLALPEGATEPATEQRLEQVLRSNQQLRERVQKLREEKEELIHSQHGLENFIRSRVSQLQPAAREKSARRSAAREAESGAYPPSP